MSRNFFLFLEGKGKWEKGEVKNSFPISLFPFPLKRNEQMTKDSEYPDMRQNYIVYEKIISHYHTLDFYISDKAAHELIDNPRLEDNLLQIPYDFAAFDVRKNLLKKKFTRHELFKKSGVFAQSVESKIWDKNAASAGRIVIAACDFGTRSIKARFAELQDELKNFPYKFGILVIAIAETDQVAAMTDKIKSMVAQDLTGRMAFYLLKTPLTEEILDRWYNAVTFRSCTRCLTYEKNFLL